MKFQNLAVVILMAVVVTSMQGSTARGPFTYTVGDNMGWTVPSQGATAYQVWANNKTFAVGDILVFNFIDGRHDVAEMSKSSYDSCNQDTVISYSAAPPVRINLTTPGPHYFTCTAPGHCSAGQQLTVTVAATTSSAAAPPPSNVATPPSSKTSPPPSTTSSPPPSSSGFVPPPSSTGPAPPSSTSTAPSPSKASPPPSSTGFAPPPSNIGSAPTPSTGAAPSPSKASPPPSYITSPPSTSTSPTPSAQSPSKAPLAPGPSPSLPGNAAASLNANRFSKTALLSQLGIVLAVGFAQQIFM